MSSDKGPARTMYLVLFLFLAILTATVNYVWLAHNTTPPFQDGIRHPPHLLPVFPAYALIFSLVLLRIPLRGARYALCGCALLVGLPYWYINLCAPLLPLSAQEDIPVRMNISLNFSRPTPLRIAPVRYSVSTLQRAYILPSRENWHHRDILDFIIEDYGHKKGIPAVLLLGNDYIIRYYQFEYYNLQAGEKVLIIEPWHAPGPLFEYGLSVKKAIFSYAFDYLVVKSNQPHINYDEMIAVDEGIDSIKKNQGEFDKRYTCAQRFSLPDASSVSIYKPRLSFNIR